MAFSQKYPDRCGQLFAVNNEACSSKHAVKLKSIGVYKGVSDLIYYADGVMCGIEVKKPDMRHAADHIRQQLEWGMTIQKAGGAYYIATSVKGFMSIIEGRPGCGVYTCLAINELLNESGSSIIFK